MFEGLKMFETPEEPVVKESDEPEPPEEVHDPFHEDFLAKEIARQSSGIPFHYLFFGALCMLIAFFYSWPIGLLGVLEGSYMIYRFPRRWEHGAVPIAMNILVMLLAIFIWG